jgi:hypothetical protein
MFFITAIFIANRKITSGYNIKKFPALKGNNYSWEKEDYCKNILCKVTFLIILKDRGEDRYHKSSLTTPLYFHSQSICVGTFLPNVCHFI